MDGYGNLDSFEGSVSGTKTITFNRRPRKVTITNDSSLNDLKFKFKDSADYATLKTTETVSMTITVSQVLLSGNASYRIWGIG